MNYKYPDIQVRDDPSLANIAKLYVENYVGDFHFIRQCKERLLLGYPLTTQQVRAILNAMLSDPTVRNLTKIESRHNRQKIDYKIRQPIKLSTVWHYNYGGSSHPKAYLAHTLDKKRSTITYYPMVNLPYHLRFTMRLNWLCGAQIVSSNVVLMNMIKNPYQACRRCQGDQHWPTLVNGPRVQVRDERLRPG